MKHGLRTLAGVLAVGAPLCAPALAQTHKVAKPENVVRAIAVYEWTGDMAKPTASRLIPVSLFINDKLEDADVYLAQPIPFALLTGNVYELQKNGIPLGTLDLEFARHLIAPETATTTYDDGWFGYGKFVPPGLPKKSTLKGTTVAISLNGMDDDRFHAPLLQTIGGARFRRRGDAYTRHNDIVDRHAAGRSQPANAASLAQQRPIQTASSGSGSTPADDADRPTLRRRTPRTGQRREGRPDHHYRDRNTLNDDPNRPLLHRGKPRAR